MVVAGTQRDWQELSAETWQDLAERLGHVVAAAGGSWLTIRAYEAGEDGTIDPDHRRHVRVDHGHCTVIIDPVSDGRERFAEAMRHLTPGAVVDEKAVTAVLYDPADVEPDLVLVLGPPTRLPPSLVWELAYSELVFEPITLHELRPEHLQAAIEEFRGRQRRFGGLDT
jgi:Putative undecaprenyl diphosphate synthase